MTFVQMMNEAKTNNVISYSWNFIRNLMFHNATMWLNYALMDKKKVIRELLHHHTLVGTLKDWENIYVVKNIIVNAHCSKIVNKFPRNILFCIWCQPVDINYPLYFDTDCTTKSSVFFPFLSAFRIKCKFLQDKVLPDQITLLSN